MPFGPFNECVWVIGDRTGRRVVYMLKDEIKHRPCVLGELFEELSEFAVKVTKK